MSHDLNYDFDSETGSVVAKRCPKCEQMLPVARFGPDKRTTYGLRCYCTDCNNLQARQRYAATTEGYETMRSGHLRRRYGLSNEDYASLLALQGKGCAICGNAHPAKRVRKGQRNPSSLYVDHDHRTGAVRGLLCFACNAALGYFNDSPKRLKAALSYLERFGAT